MSAPRCAADETRTQTREEIDEARVRVGPSLEGVAAILEVSQRALRRRLGQLEPGRHFCS